jgi:outer membrane protein TolC
MQHPVRFLALIAATLVAAGCGADREGPSASVEALSDPTPLAEPSDGGDHSDHSDHSDGRGTRCDEHAGAAAVAARPACIVDLGRLSRADCLRLALSSNRGFLVRHSQLDRAKLGETVAYSQVYAPQMSANYIFSNGPDAASAAVCPSPDAPTTSMIGVSEPVLGFNVQPFLNAGWNQQSEAIGGRDAYSSSYGLTISHMLLNIAERIRQQLPLTAAETSFYVAANNVILEGKTVELETTRAFFNVQRALAHVHVRERRVEEARRSLDQVADNVRKGTKAPAESIGANLVLNQALADLVVERGAEQDALEHLARELALPVSTPLMIVSEDLERHLPQLPNLDADLAQVHAHHEDLGNQAAEIALQIDNLKVQQDQAAPQILAGVTAQRSLLGHQPFGGDVQAGTAWSLEVSWSDPMDFKAAARAQADQIQDQIYEQTLAQREAEDDLEGRLRSTWRHIIRLRSTLELSVQRKSTEDSELAATLSRWSGGKTDYAEVSRAKVDVDNAEIQVADARCDLAIAHAEYQAILPAPTTEDGRRWEQTGAASPPCLVHPAALAP